MGLIGFDWVCFLNAVGRARLPPSRFSAANGCGSAGPSTSRAVLRRSRPIGNSRKFSEVFGSLFPRRGDVGGLGGLSKNVRPLAARAYHARGRTQASIPHRILRLTPAKSSENGRKIDVFSARPQPPAGPGVGPPPRGRAWCRTAASAEKPTLLNIKGPDLTPLIPPVFRRSRISRDLRGVSSRSPSDCSAG